MQNLLTNKDKIFEIRRKVEEEKGDFLGDHVVIPNIGITQKTISIVMTASNRSIQTYFTLKTIQNSSYKEVQIIIVDESDKDAITKEELNKYPFYIDFISINTLKKNWINPLVNYNIGFKYIKGSLVIIQNAEVCHIGDVLAFLGKEMVKDNYYICDVKASKSLKTNNIIYKSDTNTIDIYNLKNIFKKWYQCRTNKRDLHFLTGMTIDTFNKVKNFSYDYTLGVNYDDDDFLMKIKSKNIQIINLFHDEYYFGGIHLFHTPSYLKCKDIESNSYIYSKKEEIRLKTGKYIDIIDLKKSEYLEI